MADVFKALGHPGRRKVLAALSDGPMTPSELSEQLGLELSNLSAQLSVLREANMVFAERNGTSIVYHLNTSVIESALSALMTQLDAGSDDDD